MFRKTNEQLVKHGEKTLSESWCIVAKNQSNQVHANYMLFVFFCSLLSITYYFYDVTSLLEVLTSVLTL